MAPKSPPPDKNIAHELGDWGEESPDPPPPPLQGAPESRIMRRWHQPKLQGFVLACYVPFFLLGLVGGFKVTEILARRGAATLASATAGGSVVHFFTMAISFLITGMTSLLSSSAGANDHIRFGKIARQGTALALAIGVLGTAVGVPIHKPALELFRPANESLVPSAEPSLQLAMATFFVSPVDHMALSAIFMSAGFFGSQLLRMVVGYVLWFAISVGLFVNTDLELMAFAYGGIASMAVSILISLYLLFASEPYKNWRKRCGINYMQPCARISLADSNKFAGDIGPISIRSVTNTLRVFITPLLATRLSLTSGAVYAVLLQMQSAVSIPVHFALIFLGARLVGARRYHAFTMFFWRLVIYTSLVVPFIVLLFAAQGREYVLKQAKAEERDMWEAVLTTPLWAFALAILPLQAAVNILDSTLMACEHYTFIGVQFLACFCLVYLPLVYEGYSASSLTVIFAAEFVYYAVRVVSGAIWLWQVTFPRLHGEQQERSSQAGPPTLPPLLYPSHCCRYECESWRYILREVFRTFRGQGERAPVLPALRNLSAGEWGQRKRTGSGQPLTSIPPDAL